VILGLVSVERDLIRDHIDRGNPPQVFLATTSCLLHLLDFPLEEARTRTRVVMQPQK
jgi:hypothetical protein